MLNEIEFVKLVTENIFNPKVEEFSIRFIGYDYTKNAEDLAECLSNVYKQIPENDLILFQIELLKIIM
jgi:hypothetical protein